jgi:hypothetical protein
MTRSIRFIVVARLLRALFLLPLVLLALAPGVAAACAIDNTASLSADGVRAQLTTESVTDPSRWAPFTFTKAFASGSPLQIVENGADLARTLSAAERAAPFRWVLGDGTTVVGHMVTHRYARPGTYRLAVWGYDKARGWFQFDAALLHIVSPGQLTQDNLGYYALRALDIVMSGVFWLFDAALIALVLFAVLRRRSTRGRLRA